MKSTSKEIAKAINTLFYNGITAVITYSEEGVNTYTKPIEIKQ